jgi:hypothetical protein
MRGLSYATLASKDGARGRSMNGSQSARLLEEVRQWLLLNDPNGIYRDADLIAEGFPVLTLADALKLAADQTEDDRT